MMKEKKDLTSRDVKQAFRRLAYSVDPEAEEIDLCASEIACAVAKAKIAAKQVVTLRTEINFYRRWLRNLGGGQPS
jgi:hypothetical protein